MTDHFRSELINMGVAPQQIKTEKWWWLNDNKIEKLI